MVSGHVYRVLLRLFPPGFRRDEGEEAAAAFETLLREAPSRPARVRILLRCMAALPVAAVGEWWQAAAEAAGWSPPRRRDTRGGGDGMSGVWRQVRYSVRTLWKTPAFTWSAVLLVGLGVGAVTTVFTLVDQILLRPLPYPEPDRLVLVENGSHSGPLFHEMETMGTVGQWAATTGANTTLIGQGEPMRLRTAYVSRDFFRVYGARAALGRLFTDSDFADPGSTVVVDGRAWRSIWGSDPSLVGRVIRLDGRPVTVVGITDPSFEAPEAEVGRQVDFWRPLDWSDKMLNAHTAWVLSVVGRLSPGASLDAAQEEMNAVMARMAPLHQNYRDRDGNPRKVAVTS
ncbi:MAG: ABC transporter permease, partial [Gemmatimonadota bacterium]